MKDRSEVSRRGFLRRWLAGAAIAGTAALPAEAALNRMNKAASKYQNHPHGGERCAGCRHFQPPGSCEVVPGRISPRGWCKWFSAGSMGY